MFQWTQTSYTKVQRRGKIAQFVEKKRDKNYVSRSHKKITQQEQVS